MSDHKRSYNFLAFIDEEILVGYLEMFDVESFTFTLHCPLAV